MSAVYLIRHGQASFGAPDYDVLSERGHLQARRLGEALSPARARIEMVLSGEMRRHRETAQACLDAMGKPAQWRSDGAWNEFDHVHLLNALRPEFADPARLRAALMAAPDSRRAFRTRCKAALATVLDALPHGDQTGARAFGHACVHAQRPCALRGRTCAPDHLPLRTSNANRNKQAQDKRGHHRGQFGPRCRDGA